MPEDARKQIAQEQKLLLQALLAHGNTPDGFDNKRLKQAAQALVRKRVRSMKRANALVTELLDSDLSKLAVLHRFIELHPSANAAGPYADTCDFLAFLQEESGLIHKIANINRSVRFIIGQCKLSLLTKALFWF